MSRGDRKGEHNGGLSLERENTHTETSGRYDDKDVHAYENIQSELRDLKIIKKI